MRRLVSGQRYGRLTVSYPTRNRNAFGDSYTVCKCDCGNVITVLSGNLKKGHTRSCGCLERDCLKANRQVFEGEQNGFAKLTAENVKEIRRLYKAGLLQREIGELFNVTQSCISTVVRNQCWQHIN